MLTHVRAIALLVFFGFPWILQADGEVILQSTPEEVSPWFLGPLIVPTPAVVPAGHYSIQALFAFSTITGQYDRHWKNTPSSNFFNFTTSFKLIVGVTDWMDIEVQPAVLYNHKKNQSAWKFGDFPLAFGFQLLPTNRFQYFPGIELQIIETFPTGKYQKSNPKKLGTDLSGTGSFATTTNLNFYKTYHFKGMHFLSLSASFGIIYFAPVHVRSINFYGGEPGCSGKVYPGNAYNAILSFEYSITQNWALALDNVYAHLNKDRFRGKSGTGSAGRPSSESLSFAPAIEYSFSENWGIIAGVWFSAIGRNSSQFRSAIMSFEYQY